MDAIVEQALVKWPNVPDCYGWLGLDARGHWYLRDDVTQAQGSFLQAKGSVLEHEKLLAFIGRNYECDAQGRWFFQNGPQRVFVELEATPWIWRLQPDGSVRSHTGELVQVTKCLLDGQGRLYLVSEKGLGLVHSMDMDLAAKAVEEGRWSPQNVEAQQLPKDYGYCTSPQGASAPNTR